MPATLLLTPLILAIVAVGAAGVLAKRVGLLVPSAFVAAYVLGVGAVMLVSFGVLHLEDPKFREHWATAWLEIFWPLWTTTHAPIAISALLACWFSRPSTRKDAVTLLGLYLFLILLTVQIELILDANLFFLFGAFVLLSTIFFAIAHRKRAATGALDDSSTMHHG